MSDSGVSEPVADTDHCTIYCDIIFKYDSDKPFIGIFSIIRMLILLNRSIDQSPMNVLIDVMDNIDDATDMWYSIL